MTQQIADAETAHASASEAASELPNALESTARALCRFVIGAAILPVTLFFEKPSRILSAVSAARHDRTPPPFMLALVTGVVVSGVIGNLGKLDAFNAVSIVSDAAGAEAKSSTFSKAVFESYLQSTDGVKALLLAIPYIAAIWFVAGLISVCMGRGLRNAELVFAFMSLSSSAIVGLGMFGFLGVFLFDGGEGAIWVLLIGCTLYALVMAFKLIRFLFLLREKNRWSWVGAALASVPAFFITLLFALLNLIVVVVILIGQGVLTV